MTFRRFITAVRIPGQAMCCQFSPGGDTIAVAVYGEAGLVLIDTTTWKIRTAQRG